MDYENRYASKGLGVTGTTLGAVALGTSLLGGGNLLGNLLGTNWCGGGCPENMPVSRYEMAQEQKIASQASEIALLKADTYTNQKFADLNDRYNERFRNIEAELARNAVKQQAVDDSIMLVNERLECCKTNIMERLCREIDDRKCGDNTIITYANATFYPKQVADVTVGTTTTAQAVYNPLPISCCKC